MSEGEGRSWTTEDALRLQMMLAELPDLCSLSKEDLLKSLKDISSQSTASESDASQVKVSSKEWWASLKCELESSLKRTKKITNPESGDAAEVCRGRPRLECVMHSHTFKTAFAFSHCHC